MSPPGTATGVTLRRLRPEDEEAFLTGVWASPHIHPWADPPRDPPSFARWLERAGRADHESYVAVRAGGSLAGYVNVNHIVRGPAPLAHLAWAGFTGSLGQGLISAAVTEALEGCFRRLRLSRLKADIQPANLASRRLAERCGFRLQGLNPRPILIAGQWRRHERWGVEADEWPGSPPRG